MDRYHLIPCANKTGSGINVKAIVKRVIHEKSLRGIKNGPLISDDNGIMLSLQQMDRMMHGILEELLISDRSLFPPDIDSSSKIIDVYHCYRTFRKTSNTRALEMGVSETDINIVNRWRKNEKSKTGKLNLPMVHHYAQPELLIAPFKRYMSKL